MMAATMFTDLEDEFPSQCLLTDDIWDKFQLSNLDLTIFNNDIDLDTIEMISNRTDYEIRNHDCMWAGHCGSKEHSVDDVKNILVKPISQMFHPTIGAAAAPTIITSALPNIVTNSIVAPVVNKQSPVAPGRSLLLKTQPQHQQQQILMQQQQLLQQQQQLQSTQINAAAVLSNYESPPNSDDEETKSSVLQFLQEAISECDMDDDDLYDYFEDNKGEFMGEELEEEEDEEDEVVVEVKPKVEELEQIITTSATTNSNHKSSSNNVKNFGRTATMSQFVNDHCYHKDKNASMRNLGIDTPSDSEEEIDVVTPDDKHLNTQRSVSALPTNPTTRDRQQLQKTMASAITKNGIRTLQPTSRSKSAEHSPTKRRGDARGIKRNRHRASGGSGGDGDDGGDNNHSMPTSPYKKQPRVYQQPTPNQTSSDSEQEPSEKRIEHNNMERQRRIDLRNAFEELRVLVPEVNKRERAPKVVILREASVYCHKLTDVSDGMKRQVDEMRRQQKRLRARLSQLRTSLAPKHR